MLFRSGRPLQKPVKIAGGSLGQLMKNLEHPIDGVRYRTRIELSARDTKDVIAACEEWIKKFDPTKKEHAHHLLEALWVHQQHNRSEEHTSELQSRTNLVCRLLLEKKKNHHPPPTPHPPPHPTL